MDDDDRVEGGGLDEPTGVAVDSIGRAWVAGYTGVLNAYSATGIPVLASPLIGSGLSSIYAATVDANDNVWVTNDAPSSVTKVSSNGAVLSGGSGFQAGISDPYALAADPDGGMWVVNYGNSSLVQLSGGGAVTAGPFSGQTLFPESVALDAAATPWIVGQDGTVTHLSHTGTTLAHAACCHYAVGVALDNSGNVWVADYTDQGVYRLSATTGATLSTTFSSGGLVFPNAIALDGAGNAWLANLHGGTISEIAGAQNPSVGAALSPASGYGLDVGMQSPFFLAIDSSGCIWVTSFYDNRLIRFVGLATPLKTPVKGPATMP